MMPVYVGDLPEAQAWALRLLVVSDAYSQLARSGLAEWDDELGCYRPTARGFAWLAEDNYR